MTLFTHPKHVVTVYPAISTVGEDGGEVLTWGDPVEVKGNMQPLANDNLNRTAAVREEYYGTTVSNAYRFSCRAGDWVYPLNSLVVWRPNRYLAPQNRDTLAGKNPEAAQVFYANARHVDFRMSPRTQHTVVALARGNDVHREFLDGKI